ncbi:cytochrome c oxidase assembly protein [Granulicoccus sp. GXG6511]|uniref:cytochrome c oxidase assembly protein n=1 Tax=Granulicoccus sp. GXG6511 TaxID=3381351 RepID=UPI003D7C4C66
MSSPDQVEPQANPDEVPTSPVTPADEQAPPSAVRPPVPSGALLAVWAATGLGLAIVLLGTAYQSALPALRGREQADALSNHVTGVMHFGANLAMLATFGLLLAGTFYSTTKRRHHELTDAGRRLVRGAGTTAAIWCAFSLVMVPLTAAENNGVTLASALQALGPFVGATQPAQAWLIPAVVALVIAISARRMRRAGAAMTVLLIGVVWQLPPVVTGNVSVGADHDFGTDAAIFAGIAGVVAIASAAAALFTVESDADAVRGRRYGWTMAVAATVVVVSAVVVMWYELAGTHPLATGYGIASLALVIGWAMLAVRNWLGLRTRARTRAGLAADLAVGVVLTGVQTAMAHMAPPRFLAPQGSAQINFLGYEVNTPPTMASLILPGRPNLLFVTISVLAIVLYVAAHIILARRGIHWPVGRTIAWVCAFVLLLWVGSAGIWAYSGAAFSYHMLAHMTVNMLVPVLAVLGAPITLALRVLPTHAPGHPTSARELLNALVTWKPLEYLMHPVVVGINFIGTAYVVYFSGVFEYLMRYHWGHQFMTLHFLISGLLFFGLLIGADRNPRELPHVAKLGFLFAAMPFHAFFAVILLSSDFVIGSNFYRGLDVAWMTDLVADQKMGGQYTWAMGEIPMLVVVIALVFQWFAQDSRDAKRQDRAMDEGLDDAHEAYNEMLRKLSERADR